VTAQWLHSEGRTSRIFRQLELNTHVVNMHVQGIQFEIQTTTHCNLIGHSMTTLPPVLSANSILPPPPSDFTLISTRKKIRRTLMKG
jgi:hypothetical protein